ncbi:hypothetical protein ACFVYE_32400 [Streptomyces sp. NPDC058239]
MSAELASREVEATDRPGNLRLPVEQPDEPPAHPHEPGARSMPLSRLLYP